MRKTFSSLFLLVIATYLFAQTKPARLIVRGDDMGFSHSANEAIVECYKNGIESSVEVLIPSPCFLKQFDC